MEHRAPTPRAFAPTPQGTPDGWADDPAVTAQVAQQLKPYRLQLNFESPHTYIITTPEGYRLWMTRGLHAVRAIIRALDWQSQQRAKGGGR